MNANFVAAEEPSGRGAQRFLTLGDPAGRWRRRGGVCVKKFGVFSERSGEAGALSCCGDGAALEDATVPG